PVRSTFAGGVVFSSAAPTLMPAAPIAASRAGVSLNFISAPTAQTTMRSDQPQTIQFRARLRLPNAAKRCACYLCLSVFEHRRRAHERDIALHDSRLETWQAQRLD